jgi:hypothetical protein
MSRQAVNLSLSWDLLKTQSGLVCPATLSGLISFHQKETLSKEPFVWRKMGEMEGVVAGGPATQRSATDHYELVENL